MPAARAPDDGGARETLRAAGIADDQNDPAVLVALAGRTADLDVAIIERLGGAPSESAAAAIAEVARGAEKRGWKAALKAARRALYRFGQRGIAAPSIATPPAPEPARSTTTLEGYVSPVDGRGDRLVWLVRPQRNGGLVVITAILNEPGGLRDVAIADLGRKTLRRMERDLQERHRLRMVAADGRYCDALLWEGFERARAAGTKGVGEYPAYRARVTSQDPAPLDPPLIARVTRGLERRDSLPARRPSRAQRTGAEPDVDAPATIDPAALLAEPEFATWGFEPDALAPYVAEIASVRESTLVLSRPLQEERIHAIIGRALSELLSGDRGRAFRRRLEEMAYYLHASGRPAQAHAAAATARALGASARGGEGIPFLDALVRRSFAAVLAEEGERAKTEAESSLLVRPGAPTRGLASSRHR